MTNKQFLIKSLSKTPKGHMAKKEFVEQVFELVYKRDWKIFCSQMGDYDHPGERVSARKEFEESVAKLNSEHPVLSDVVEYLVQLLEKTGEPLADFYNSKFHEMNEKYIPE